MAGCQCNKLFAPIEEKAALTSGTMSVQGQGLPRLLKRQFKLALFLARLVLAFRDRADRRFNTERLQQPISAPTASSTRKAPNEIQGSAPGLLRVASQVAADVALRAVVADEQPAPTMAAAQEAGEQSLPRVAAVRLVDSAQRRSTLSLVAVGDMAAMSETAAVKLTIGQTPPAGSERQIQRCRKAHLIDGK